MVRKLAALTRADLIRWSRVYFETLSRMLRCVNLTPVSFNSKRWEKACGVPPDSTGSSSDSGMWNSPVSSRFCSLRWSNFRDQLFLIVSRLMDRHWAEHVTLCLLCVISHLCNLGDFNDVLSQTPQTKWPFVREVSQNLVGCSSLLPQYFELSRFVTVHKVKRRVNW